MNSAVAKLADAANKGGRGGASREPLKVLGKHPRTEAEIKLMAGRYGPYVTDGTTNATLPKAVEQDALTLEEAAQLIDARAAAAPAKKGKKAPAKKAAAKKPAAKKAPAKKKAAAE
jgi:DNA topoisomerase-1